MVAYADTSFLVSLYLPEETSARAMATARRLAGPLPMSLLLLLEFRNALNLRIERAALEVGERNRIWRSLEDDMADGIFSNVPLSLPDIFREARELSNRLSPKLGTRSLDLLHLASARSLKVKEVYTFDERQASAAKEMGLKVRP